MFRNRNHNAHEIDFNCICMHGLIQLVEGFFFKIKSEAFNSQSLYCHSQ